MTGVTNTRTWSLTPGVFCVIVVGSNRCGNLTEFSNCLASWARQPTTCGQPLKANSSSSASILSFSSLWAWTICFSRNWTWAKCEVRARREEFSKACSSSSFSSLTAISSSVAEEERLCVGWLAFPLPLSSSGLATAPTGAHRSPAPATTASLSEADSSSVDILDAGVHCRSFSTAPVFFLTVCFQVLRFLLLRRQQQGSPPKTQVYRHLGKDDSYVKSGETSKQRQTYRKSGTLDFRIKASLQKKKKNSQTSN